MRSEGIAVFDLGGTWFRWGRYSSSGDLLDCERAPAISYLSHPHLDTRELQHALTEFIIRHTREMRERSDLPLGCVSIGAPVNAHDGTVLGSGPLWGTSGHPFKLEAGLREMLPEVRWCVVNDVTALLATFMSADAPCRKTLLVTVSSGIGSRLYDHRSRRIPYDAVYGIQGEIGHLPLTFELDGRLISRQCECRGQNHLNAFSSGRGIAQILKELPTLSPRYAVLLSPSQALWEQVSDDYRLQALETLLRERVGAATELLDAFVTPLCRTLCAALSLDPEIDRIVITGGVAHGLGRYYRESLQRAFLRDGLYQVSERDPDYLARRLHWAEPDDFNGLRGAGIYAQIDSRSPAS